MTTDLDLRVAATVRVVDHAHSEPAQAVVDRFENGEVDTPVGWLVQVDLPSGSRCRDDMEDR